MSHEITPALTGSDAFAIERCWQLARPATFDILRDRRASLVACALIDTALWDAIGKSLGVPLRRLWRGFSSPPTPTRLGHAAKRSTSRAG